MTAGRCAGCGYTNNSCKLVRNHTTSCSDYARLFREEPDKALDPEAEFVRYNSDDRADEKAEAKNTRLEAKFAELDAQRERQADRWMRPKDVLDV